MKNQSILGLVLWLGLFVTLFSLHSCVSAKSAHDATAEWDSITAPGTIPTPEKLNHFSQTMHDLDSTGHASVIAATTGDWKTLLLQVLVGVAGLGATGVATYAKVNSDRNASSPARTANDLAVINATPSLVKPMS